MFRKYRRKELAEIRDVNCKIETAQSLITAGVSISKEDIKTGSPRIGDKIARNPKNHNDQWLVSKKYFEDNFEIYLEQSDKKEMDISCIKGAKKNISDLKTFGDGDLFRLISKASSLSQGWMKSTKAMQIYNVGCVVQVTTQQGDNVAEALTFIPNTKIIGDGENRKIVQL